jgi:lambda family phage portal protein
LSERPTIVALGGALEGAERFDRETALWYADRRHPDQIIHQVKDEADFRGRETVTNDGYAQGLVDIYRDTIVGNQYRLNAQPNWEVLQRLYSSRFDESWAADFTMAVEDKFNLISESASCWLDAQRKLTLSGLVRLAISGFVYTGEVVATVEWIREVGRPFSTAIQIISPARLSNPNGQSDDANLRRGVQRDSRGKAVAYYIRVNYPTTVWPDPNNFKWELWPAQKPWGRRQVIHITDTIQPDQTRGISALVAVLKQMKMTKRFQEVTLQNAIIKASYAASIESDMPREMIAAQLGQTPASPEGLNAVIVNTAGALLAAVQQYAAAGDSIAIDGAKIAHFFPGTSLKVHPLGGPGDLVDGYEDSLLRHIAAGLGISFEEFSADFTKSNYSNARAAMLKTYKHMQARKRFVADRFADEIYALWLEEDFNDGGLPLPRGFDQKIFYQPYGKEAITACDWIGSGRGQIDELKETQAALLRVKGGLSTREIEIAKAGQDWRKLFRQLQREQSLADELGLTFDSNLQRDATTSGQTVMQENA